MNPGKDKPNIVIPTIRNGELIENFFSGWSDDFRGCHIILIEDKPVGELGEVLLEWSQKSGFTYEHYDWQSIEDDLGEKAWIFSRQSDAIRSYGFYRAWLNQALFIVTLDDDVLPAEPSHHIQEFGRLLLEPVYGPDTGFYSTLKGQLPRGTTPKENKVVLAHGMWIGCADYSARDQLKNHEDYGTLDEEDFNEGIVPKGCLFSVCSMNVAFATDYASHSYFGLQGSYKPKGSNEIVKLPLDRCGDIWTGFRMKWAADENGHACHTGKPYVYHNRASNIWNSLEREKNGWDSTEEYAENREIRKTLPAWYIEEWSRARMVWMTLFDVKRA